MRLKGFVVCVALVAVAIGATVAGAEEFKLNLSGATYTKWLWGNQRYDGSVYNFTTVPGEGYGDNGQGSEVELFLNAKVSAAVEVKARLHSRFNQNQWTNFGGWGGSNPPTVPCVGGDCGEFDSRSNQYVKLRGVAVMLTPGYSWLDLATIGANDFGQFDPFVIGKIRYIDRDNASGLLFQGSFLDKKLRYDAARISLPRLWAGPNWSTGTYKAADGAYGLQLTLSPSGMFDIAAIGEYVNDIEVDSTDWDLDDGREIRTRFRNSVAGVRFGVHPSSVFDISGRYYKSWSDSVADLSPASFGINGYSSTLAGKHDDETWRLNVDVNDPFGVGLSFAAEVFDIGAEYVSMMAARREADVLLTEGYESTYAFPGPSNASYGIWGGNATRIGFGGWDGNAQQVATINVDNEFTDFDEPMAETAIGWKGWTLAPQWNIGDLELGAEYTDIDYNQNWQAWGDDTRSITDTVFPGMELDTGVGHNFRSAYAPFMDRETKIYLVKAKYLVDVGSGLEIFGKVKWIDESDKRLNDPRYLPFVAGDCPGGGEACAGVANYYFGTNTTSGYYSNPPVITGAGGAVGYQWKPFDDIADDDRDLDFTMYQLGFGYQLTDELHGTLTYEMFDVELADGNTAFQAYQLMEMASGEHEKDKISLKFKYFLAGMEFGLVYQYLTGEFEPNFGGGFVPTVADENAIHLGAAPGSLGFYGRYGGWNSLEEREFQHERLKAFMKVVF